MLDRCLDAGKGGSENAISFFRYDGEDEVH